jgi:hypothetical protein
LNIKQLIGKSLKVISTISFIAVLFFLASCNDLPTEVGYNLLGDTISIKVITNNDYPVLYDTKVPNPSSSGFNATKIFCGKANGITASSIVRFGNIPDTLSYLTEADIQSVEISVFPKRYAFGDTVAASFGFKIKKVEKFWSVEANLDTISVPDFFGREIGNYSGSIALKDTMPKIVINLDKSLITDWFKLRTDTSKAVVNYGIGLIPDNNCNVIYTFGGEGISKTENNPPIIKVIYKNKEAKLDSIYLYTGINANFFDMPKYGEDDIVFQSGLDAKTNLYFDISNIPPFTSIAKMELELTLNREKSYFGNMKPKEYFRIDFVSDSSGAKSSNFYYADKLDSNSFVYKCSSITSAAQIWNRFSGKGILQIRGADFEQQFQRLDKFVFYGLNDPDTNKRPKVKVVYSIQTHK